MSKLLREYLRLFLFAGLIVAADQITKSIVRTSLAPGEAWMPWEWLSNYARIVHWYNTGVAFGMFQGMGMLFSILSILVVIAIVYYYPRIPAADWSLKVAMTLQMGGAIGNLIDRLTIGHVTDFISVGNFPVFNVADSCITLGVVVLIIGVWLQERKAKQGKQDSDSLASPLTKLKDGEGLE
ncbi:MAG: signal peptidase II [Anaerolineae bacterium]|nr:signal peptidase II [Anaerolineae bacterium]